MNLVPSLTTCISSPSMAVQVTVPGNANQYPHPIVGECGSTVEISMFATSAAGSGETTATNLTFNSACECCSIKVVGTPR